MICIGFVGPLAVPDPVEQAVVTGVVLDETQIQDAHPLVDDELVVAVARAER